MLGAQIASLHNIAFYLRLVTGARRHIGPKFHPLGRSGWSPNSAAGCNTRTTMKRKPAFPLPRIQDPRPVYPRQVLEHLLLRYRDDHRGRGDLRLRGKIDNFGNKAPLKAIIFDYYLNFIPYFINQFSGLFTFIAVIFFTSKMAYQTEIVAMLSGGMSFRRLMWPYFLGALIIASLSLGLNLWLIPVSQRSCVAFENQYIPRKARFQYDKNIYRQIEPGTFAYIRNYSKESNQASFFSLEEYESGAMTASLEAAEVRFNPRNQAVVGRRYTTRTLISLGVETFTQHRNLDTLINLDVNELGRTDQLIKTMNIVELNQFLEQQRSKGSDSINIIQVEQHARYAYPVGTFILTLIGVSLSSRKVRGGTGLHIGIGIALCFSYILFIRFFEEFAKSGTLPPWIAVWIPNVLYLCIAVYLYRKAPK